MTTFTYTPAQEEWLQLLEKGDLAQTTGVLSCEGGMCCLGVAAKLVLKDPVQRVEPDDEDYDTSDLFDHVEGEWYEYVGGVVQILNARQTDALGLRSDSGYIETTYPGVEAYMKEQFERLFGTLVEMNDNEVSFQQIAAFIRKFPEAVFK